jgi:hypothetical protein
MVADLPVRGYRPWCGDNLSRDDSGGLAGRMFGWQTPPEEFSKISV